MNRAPRVGPPTQVGYATRGVSLLNEALCWEKPGRALQVGNPHLTFPRPGKRQGPKFHPHHQPQHLQEAPLNRLLNESMRLIRTDVGCLLNANTSRLVIPFPGLPGNLLFRDVASFGAGAGGGVGHAPEKPCSWEEAPV